MPFHTFPGIKHQHKHKKKNLHWLRVTWCLRFRTRRSTDACGWSPSLSQWNWRATEMNRSNLALITIWNRKTSCRLAWKQKESIEADATNCKTFGFHINVLVYIYNKGYTNLTNSWMVVAKSSNNMPAIVQPQQPQRNPHVHFTGATHQSKAQGWCSNLLKRRQHTLRQVDGTQVDFGDGFLHRLVRGCHRMEKTVKSFKVSRFQFPKVVGSFWQALVFFFSPRRRPYNEVSKGREKVSWWTSTQNMRVGGLESRGSFFTVSRDVSSSVCCVKPPAYRHM